MTEKVATTLEEALAVALKLSPRDKVRLVERVVSTLEREVTDSPQTPRRSFFGLLAEFGPAPSEEDFEEIRREMWGNFPREDIV
jgi:hypothetical protein